MKIREITGFVMQNSSVLKENQSQANKYWRKHNFLFPQFNDVIGELENLKEASCTKCSVLSTI